MSDDSRAIRNMTGLRRLTVLVALTAGFGAAAAPAPGGQLPGGTAHAGPGAQRRPMAAQHAAGPTTPESDALRLEVVDAAGGAATAVAWDGALAYVALGQRILAVDTSSPAAPTVVARSPSTGALVEDLASAAGFTAAWVPGTDSILIFGLPEAGLLPLRRRLAADTFGLPVHGLAVDEAGTHLYVVAGERLLALALSEDAVPARADGAAARGGPAAWRGLVAAGRTGGGLGWYELAADGFSSGRSVEGPLLDDVLAAGQARALGLNRGAAVGLELVSYALDERLNPVELGRLPLAAGAAVAADARRGLAAWAGDGRVQALDASAPVPLPGGSVVTHVPLAVGVAGEVGFVGGTDGLRLLGLADPARPRWLGTLREGAGMARTVAWRHGRLVAAGPSGLAVFDAPTDDTRLVARGYAARPGPVGGLLTDEAWGAAQVVMLDQAYALAASNEAGLVIYDVSLPDAPSVAHVVSATLLGDPARSVALNGATAYVGGPTGVAVLDMADPEAPEMLGRVPTDAEVTSLVAEAGMLLAGTRAGLLSARLDDRVPASMEGVVGVEAVQGLARAGTRLVALEGAKLAELEVVGGVTVRRRVALPDPGTAVADGGELGGDYAVVALRDAVIVVDLAAAEPAVSGRLKVGPGTVAGLEALPGGLVAAAGFLGVERVEVEAAAGPMPTATSGTPGVGHSILLPRVWQRPPGERVSVGTHPALRVRSGALHLGSTIGG